MRIITFLLLLAIPVAFLTARVGNFRAANEDSGPTQGIDHAEETNTALATVQPDEGASAAPRRAPVQVVIDNFTFSPAELTIKDGTKVTWVKHDDVPHTATSTSKPRLIDSGALDTDDQFAHVVSTPGN